MEDEIKDIIVEENSKSLQDLQEEYLKKQVENGSTLNDITNDFAKAKVTSKLLDETDKENEKFHKELKEEQKETLKESFKQDKIKQQKQTLEEKQKKAEAFYLSVRPILEFDFGNLVKSKTEKTIKDYKDRSYGIPLMCLMLLIFTPIYCIVSIVLAIFNGINAILETISTFGKISRFIALSIFIIAIGSLVVYGAILGVEQLFNVEIINKII